MKNNRRVVILIMAGVLLASGYRVPPAMARGTSVIDPVLAATLSSAAPDQRLSVIVILNGQADVRAPGGHDDAERQRNVINLLHATADAAQTGLREWLKARQGAGQVEAITPLWIINAMAVRADRSVIDEMSRLSQVRSIVPDATIQAPAPLPSNAAATPDVATPRDTLMLEQQTIEPNLQMINAPAAWARGITGQGIVVALLDSGVSMDSPDLAARWRGGSNSWFDPYNEHPDAPVDTMGHGTQMLGVILGGGAGGSRIGVAPDAKWIAARIFDNRGRATTSSVHRVLQWVLDPDGDPATPDAPQVANNSWSFVNPGCSDEFSEDLRALRAAGILPVFAAGTNAPVGPANTAEAFAVGSLSDDHTVSADSAHGPSKCRAAAQVYPQIVAPGAHIRTTDLYGKYLEVAGTSIAAAHVSGALALLLSARRGLSAEEQASILTRTAVDLGQPGPDNHFGYGRLDIAAMIDQVLGPAPVQSTPSDQAANPMTPSNSANGGLVVVIAIAAAAVGILVIVRRARSAG